MCPNSKVYLATNAKRRVIKIMVTDGTKVDFKVTFALIKYIKTDILIAYRVRDTNDILEYAKNNGTEIVNPPKSNKKPKKIFDNPLYYYRHIIKSTFLAFKRCCIIITCYVKTFISAFFLRSISIFISSRF